MSGFKLLALIFLVSGLARAQELFQDEDDFANSDVDRIYVKALQNLSRTGSLMGRGCGGIFWV